MKTNASFFDYFMACACIFIWGITFVCTKYLLNYFSSLEILFIRFLIAYLSLCIMKPSILKFENWKRESLFMAAGFSGITFYQLMENVALSYTQASNVSIIVSICPIITALMAQIFLKEKHLSVCFVTGFILAIFGIALISFNGSVVLHLSPKGDILAFLAALSWGFYSLFVSKINELKLDPILATRRNFFWSLIFMIPLCILGAVFAKPESQFFINLSTNHNLLRFTDFYSWFNLCFLGIGASAFCFAAWNIACKKIGMVQTTLGLYFIPVVTVVVAFIVLKEKINLMGIIGMILTVTGLIVSSIKKTE